MSEKAGLGSFCSQTSYLVLQERIVHTMRATLEGEGEGRRSSQTAKAPCWLFGCFSVVSKVSHSRAAWAPAHKTHQSERHTEN
jgi:hypothetical protein